MKLYADGKVSKPGFRKGNIVIYRPNGKYGCVIAQRRRYIRIEIRNWMEFMTMTIGIDRNQTHIYLKGWNEFTLEEKREYRRQRNDT